MVSSFQAERQNHQRALSTQSFGHHPAGPLFEARLSVQLSKLQTAGSQDQELVLRPYPPSQYYAGYRATNLPRRTLRDPNEGTLLALDIITDLLFHDHDPGAKLGLTSVALQLQHHRRRAPIVQVSFWVR